MCSPNNTIRKPGYWLWIIVLLAVSCHRYYKPVESATNPETVKQLIDASATTKYFILRQGKNHYALSYPRIDNVAMTLNASLSKVDTTHLTYLKSKPRKYSYNDDKILVLHEIHIYSKDSFPLNISESLVLPLDRIDKIELIEHDKKRTSTSNAIIATAVTVGVLAAIIGIGAATFSMSMNTSFGFSCPVVSVFDGQQYRMQGELYPGALGPKMQQNDNLVLNANPVNGEIQIKIANDLNERAFTDYAHLAVIEHDQSTQVGTGTDGKLYGLTNPVSPISAALNDGRDMLNVVSGLDQKVCSFDDTLSKSSISELTLSFLPKGDRSNAKLVVQLKNTAWWGFVYENYISHYGKKYSQYQEKVNDQPANEIKQWYSDQQIPLTISVSTAAGWKEVAQLNMVGVQAYREVVIPVELEAGSADPIRFKLSCGFLFWELDYAAMDFTPPMQFASSTLTPFSAVNEMGKDVLDPLLRKDGIYFTQPEMGNEVTLKYKWNQPVRSGKSYSFLLLTKGYYELVRDFVGNPDVAFLSKFNDPNALSMYSKEKFQSVSVRPTIHSAKPD